MANRPVFRLAEAVLLFLFLMLPLMVLLGAAEGTDRRPALLFWVFRFLPFLVLPWLWSRQHPDEKVEQVVTADDSAVVTARAADELPVAVAPVVDVQRSYVPGGLPVAEGRLKTSAADAFHQLENLLSPRQRTPLLEGVGGGGAGCRVALNRDGFAASSLAGIDQRSAVAGYRDDHGLRQRFA